MIGIKFFFHFHLFVMNVMVISGIILRISGVMLLSGIMLINVMLLSGIMLINGVMILISCYAK